MGEVFKRSEVRRTESDFLLNKHTKYFSIIIISFQEMAQLPWQGYQKATKLHISSIKSFYWIYGQ